MRAGDRVELLVPDIYPLRHRKRPLYGFIVKRDGHNLLVRPAWCKWEMHLYTTEVRV